ncbi:hypothetical protein HJC23_003895 [Cyclotella cryptica]|uniref:PAC domain-containing protein n=1 Tax=Cyclotella cryptica TaxID=29204 RepID=A0ABD3PEB4_9STRA|eukprot:CCRYP_015571-RA/>CCRYP_015571-RA protein AED:0.20 eAED:0.20 QI:281/1/1/1/1/1/2/130/308
MRASTARHVMRLIARQRVHSPLSSLKSPRANYASYALWKTMHTNEEASKAKSSFFDAFDTDSSMREQVVYSLSFTNDNLDNDLASDDTFPLLDKIMTRQLLNSYSTLQSPSSVTARNMRSKLPPQLNLSNLQTLHKMENTQDSLPELEQDHADMVSSASNQPLPRTIHEITPSKLDQDKRAIVITDIKQPFPITAVNTAWEELCGYKRDECAGKSLGPLLQGPDTDWAAVSALLTHLFAGEEASVVLTNYTNSGRRFRNLVRVGPVRDEMGKTVSFVGVLRELKEDDEGSSERHGRHRREIAQLPFVA